MTNALHDKYRPTHFDDVTGQDHVTKSLRNVVKKRTSHAFLFSGPSGCGKTTLARIAAAELGCEERAVQEINTADKTGVEHMRELQDMLQFRPFGSDGPRAVILDECHMLSRNAWNSLLKLVEEPPEFVYLFFCTTEPGKVPKTIKTRCASYDLKLVKEKELTVLVEWVADEEGLNVDETVISVIVKAANGSPRQALVNLAQTWHAKNKKEAEKILEQASSSDATYELCQAITSPNCSWLKAMGIFAKIEEEQVNPEGVRIVVCHYLSSVAKSAKTNDRAGAALELLDCFSTSYNPSEGYAPLLMSIGRAVLS